MLGKAISNMMIKPGKAPVFENPEQYGLDYEDVTFDTKDGVTLSGWIVKGGTDKVIIQSHFGVQCSRSGFTIEGKGMMEKMLWNKDIHFLNQAKYLVDAGYTVLMYDLRNHGESGSAEEEWITWGLEERKDVIAAVEFMSNHEVYKDANIGLLSICMGAASTTFAYGMEEDLQANTNIKSMIAVQPLTYDFFLQNLGLPKFVTNAGSKYSKKKRNVDLTGDSFLPYTKDIKVPTMVIQNKNDNMTDLGMVDQYYQSLTCEKKYLSLDLEKKRAAAYDWLGKNPDEILDWFGKYV